MVISRVHGRRSASTFALAVMVAATAWVAVAVSGFAMGRLTVAVGSTRRLARCAGSTAATALTAAAVGACLLTSCTSPAGTAGTAGPPAAPPATAWQRVLSQIGPDGSVSKQTALEAFVLAIGPLPGVPRPAGTAQVIDDGSGPVRWLLGYYSQLTAGQQAAVRRLLDVPVTTSAQPAGAGTGPATLHAAIRRAAPAGPGPGQAADQALEQQAAAQIASRLGVKLKVGVQIVENPTHQESPDTLAYTVCLDAAGLADGPFPAAKCTIFINPEAHSSPATEHVSMLHEVFHCFEAQLEPSIGAYNSAAKPEAWLIEGAAEWVSSDFATDPVTSGWWLDYLMNPDRPLFERTYDAIGWFGHLYPGGGVSPWTVLAAMIRAPGSAPAYEAATAGASPNFLDTEASVFFENASLGRAWYQNGVQGQPPGTAAASAPPPGLWAKHVSPVKQVTIGTLPVPELSAPPYADAVVSLRLTAPVTEITVASGHARLRSLTGTHDYADPGTLYLCTASGPCSGCSKAAKLPRFASPGDLALDGGPQPAVVLVQGMTTKDLCARVTTAPPSPGNSTPSPPHPVACDEFPSLGPPGTVITGGVPRTINGITTLSCVYSQPKGYPYGWIIIMTFRSRAAAAAFFTKEITGTPVPGFTQPVESGGSCPPETSTATVCDIDEFALHGYRIDEVAQQHPATPMTDLTLKHIGTLMRQVLAVT